MLSWLASGWGYFDAATMGEGGRLVATLCVCLGALGALAVRRHLLERGGADFSQDERRTKLVWSRNLVLGLLSLFLVILWGYRVSGFAFSLAAVAGALVIVNKELILSFTGYAILTLTRPFSVGNYVQIGRFSGRVIDIRLLGTTLAETGAVNQLTGTTVSVPHAQLLTEAVRNMSATGVFGVQLYRMTLPISVDIAAMEVYALEAAERVTSAWRDEADAHLAKLEKTDFVDLPSARPKVLWESLDSKSIVLLIRFACPSDKRVQVEQEIFRGFWAKAFPPGDRKGSLDNVQGAE